MKQIVKINPKYKNINSFIQFVPRIFSENGETIHHARNTIKLFRINGLLLNIKCFQKPNIINRFVYRYIRASKAERSFRHALYIQQQGIDTPDPVAFIEIHDKGILTESYYISIHQTVDGRMEKIYEQSKQENQKLIHAFTLFTADLHRKGILHKDYSPGNILYRKQENGYHFYLVDLNRMKFRKLSFIEKCQSFARFRLDTDILYSIADTYSKALEINEKACRKLIPFCNKIFWEKYEYRHPEIKLAHK